MLSLLLVLALQVQAAPAATVAKKFSLTEMIQKTLAIGTSRTLKPPMSELLGFSGEVPVKILRTKKTVSPDGQEHVFNVIEASTAVIVLTRTRVTDKGEAKIVEGAAFRAQNGRLTHAMRAFGRAGEVEQQGLPVEDKKYQRWFQDEMVYFMKIVPSKGLLLE